MLPHGSLPEVLPPYLQNLIRTTGGPEGPIGLQYIARPDLERAGYEGKVSDPLMEDKHKVAPGLIYKYTASEEGKGRVLWTITRNCAAYCRFCTRGREVGIPTTKQGTSENTLASLPRLNTEQLNEALSFIANEPGLNEVIVSGGDPFTINPAVLLYSLRRLGALQRKGKLDIVRIATRLPFQNPHAIKEQHYKAVEQLKNPRLIVHINHPAELTDSSLAVLDRFRRESGAIVYSQTVLLRGINDSVSILRDLFNKMANNGINPYYVYQNDPVYWAKHFTVPLREAIAMWQQLRPSLSGLAATARFVIDTPEGYGKIPIPEGDAWKIDYTAGFVDFKGATFPLLLQSQKTMKKRYYKN